MAIGKEDDRCLWIGRREHDHALGDNGSSWNIHDLLCCLGLSGLANGDQSGAKEELHASHVLFPSGLLNAGDGQLTGGCVSSLQTEAALSLLDFEMGLCAYMVSR
jgi:hypothetical protein